MNQVQLVGNIARDPEFRTTQSGIAACTFTVACQRRYANAQGVREADFIQCVAWRQTAEFISRYFSKGKMIAVEGSLRTRTYDDKRHPDVKHYVTEIYADQVYFAGDSGTKTGTQNNNGYTQNQPTAQQNGYSNVDIDDFSEIISDVEPPF